MKLENEHRRLLNKSGYTKGVAKLAHRIVLLKEKINNLYPPNEKP